MARLDQINKRLQEANAEIQRIQKTLASDPGNFGVRLSLQSVQRDRDDLEREFDEEIRKSPNR